MDARMVLVGCLVGLVVLSIASSIAADEDNTEEMKIPDKIPDIPYDEKISQLVSQSVMNFAHDLAIALDTNEYPNTQIFSPLSVMSVLSILQMGSYGNSYNQLNQLFSLLNGENGSNSSKIHEEFGWLLEDVMLSRIQPKRSRSLPEWRLKPFNDHAYRGGGKNDLDDQTIRVSNGLFIQNGFSLRADYAYAAQSVYKSEVTPLDFRHNSKQSKHYINSWVKQNTLGKIPTLIDDELSDETNMVLASTLYFKGFWEKVFYDADDNRKEAFYPDGPESMPVGITFMANGGSFPFYDSKKYNCRIIGLPYKGNQTTMYVIQPNDSTRLNLQQLQKNLTGEVINELISKMEYRTAIIVFPKFHVESKMQLKNPLKRMGIEDIFINGQADLALIADPEENEKDTPASSSYPTSSWTTKLVPIPQHLETNSNTVEDSTSSPSFGTKNSPSSNSEVMDRFGDSPLIFSRFSDETANQTTVTDQPEQQHKMENTKKDGNDDVKLSEMFQQTTITPSEGITEPEEKPSPSKHRRRRDYISPSTKSLQRLDQMRSMPGLKNPSLFVDEIVHKVDFNVNEQGTEAAAATAGYLLKSGPNVSMRCDTPFLILVRHDPTKLPLFYGIVNIPV